MSACYVCVCVCVRGPHSVSSIHRPNYATNWAWSVANTCALSQKNCPSAIPKIVSRNDVFCTEQLLPTLGCVCVDFNLFSIAVRLPVATKEVVRFIQIRYIRFILLNHNAVSIRNESRRKYSALNWKHIACDEYFNFHWNKNFRWWEPKNKQVARLRWASVRQQRRNGGTEQMGKSIDTYGSTR